MNIFKSSTLYLDFSGKLTEFHFRAFLATALFPFEV